MTKGLAAPDKIPDMEIKANDTFWQRRKIRGLPPILMEVLEVEEVIGTRDICKVRWHIVGKDSVSTSTFPMATITQGHFASFIPIPRELFLKAMSILNIHSLGYPKCKQKILSLMKDYHYTDDKPWKSSPQSNTHNRYENH